jgi:hypothetical protein
MAQPVDEPALRHNLHPGTNTRGTGTDPHQAKIAVLKCLEDSAKRRSLHVLEAALRQALSSHEAAFYRLLECRRRSRKRTIEFEGGLFVNRGPFRNGATIARTHTAIRTHRVRTPTHALYILT